MKAFSYVCVANEDFVCSIKSLIISYNWQLQQTSISVWS